MILVLADRSKQRPLTRHYAIDFLDQLLSASEGTPALLPGSPKNEVILAPLCVLLASKFDELDSNIPQISTLLRLYSRSIRFSNTSRSCYSQRASSSERGGINWTQVAHTLTYEDMVQAEKAACSILDWRLLVVSPL